MTATEELRRLLDERGVGWKRGLPTETIVSEPIDALYVERPDGRMHVYFRSYFTPEQAIAVTLGRERTCTMELTDLSSGSAYHDVWLCSACGEQVEQHTVMGKSEPPRYCPSCGRKVER